MIEFFKKIKILPDDEPDVESDVELDV